MLIGVPAETRDGETRVAATAETVKKLVASGHRHRQVSVRIRRCVQAQRIGGRGRVARVVCHHPLLKGDVAVERLHGPSQIV